MDDLSSATAVATFGMQAQSKRLRVVAENLANAQSVALTPGGDPYRRKEVVFQDVLDRETGIQKVQVNDTVEDMSDFGREFRPGSPGADAKGYVLTPNVVPLIEVQDMREAQQTYQANLQVVSTSHDMISKTLDLLK